MRGKRLMVALGVVVLLGSWSGVGAADDETPEHFCVPDGKGGWERHDNVSPEEAGELAERGGFEIDEENPCPPDEGAGGIGLGNLCQEQPRHPACNPDETKVPNSNKPCRRPSRVHCVGPPHHHHPSHEHPQPRAVETPVGGVDTGGWPDGPEHEQAGREGTVLIAALGGLVVAPLLLRRIRRHRS